MPMFIALLCLTLFLFTLGLASVFYSDHLKKGVKLSFLYFGYSLTGHLLALPCMMLSLGLCLAVLTGETQSTLLATVNAVSVGLFATTLYTAHKGTKLLNAILPGDNNPNFKDFIMGGLLPFKYAKKGVKRLPNIAYGEAGRKNLLDIYTPPSESAPQSPRPVLIHIHGGAWCVGQKKQQAQPLINHMVSKGWIAVDINYRLGPKHRFPTLFEDVMRAIAWVKTHIGEYGGDPNFITLTGGSAGGHLTALSALMPNNPDFKSGFKDIDCRVQAAVPVYGVYDFIDRTGALASLGQAGMETFVTEKTMPGPRATHEAFWDTVSPMGQIQADAPPFLILHGRQDALAAFRGAEIFADALSKTSQQEVVFAALPGGQHAYDCANGIPTPAHVRLIERFLTRHYQAHLSQ